MITWLFAGKLMKKVFFWHPLSLPQKKVYTFIQLWNIVTGQLKDPLIRIQNPCQLSEKWYHAAGFTIPQYVVQETVVWIAASSYQTFSRKSRKIWTKFYFKNVCVLYKYVQWLINFIEMTYVTTYMKKIVKQLRIPDIYDAKITEICHIQTFWPATQLINHLFKIWQITWISWITIKGQNVRKLQIFAIFASQLSGIL